jgi:hypothetical protein
MMFTTYFNAVSAARALRRVKGPALVLGGIPLLVLFGGAAGAQVYERVTSHYDAAERVGALTREQAARRAERLVARVTGQSAEALDAHGYSGSPGASAFSRRGEWQVTCQAGADRYFLRLDAYTAEPIVVFKEGRRAENAGPDARTRADGDLTGRGGVSRREALSWARRYLRLAGLPLPADARLLRDRGYDFLFRCAAGAGASRTLRVRVSPGDGSLEHLHNVAYHLYPRHPFAATAADAAG